MSLLLQEAYPKSRVFCDFCDKEHIGTRETARTAGWKREARRLPNYCGRRQSSGKAGSKRSTNSRRVPKTPITNKPGSHKGPGRFFGQTKWGVRFFFPFTPLQR